MTVDNDNATTEMVTDPITTESPTTTEAPTSTEAPTTTTTTTTTEAPTTTEEPCDINNPFYPRIQDFTNNTVFMQLSENEQIFVYEMLAAAEGCNMEEFMKPTTAERIFRLLLDLPLRFTTDFTAFLSTALTNEGVVVPI